MTAPARPSLRPMLRRSAGAAGLALLAALPAGGVAAADSTAPLAFGTFGAAPVADNELATLRGGFITAEGLEISFGFRVELDVADRLQLTARFNPIAKSGEPAVGLSLGGDAPGGPLTELEVTRDGKLQVLAGTPKVTERKGGTRYRFGDGAVAELPDSGDGFTFTSGGALPVTLTQSGEGLDLVVGDATTTLVVDRLSPRGVDAKVANRLDGAGIDHQLFFDINLLNFSDLAPARRVAHTGRRLQNLVNRGVVGWLTPR